MCLWIFAFCLIGQVNILCFLCITIMKLYVTCLRRSQVEREWTWMELRPESISNSAGHEEARKHKKFCLQHVGTSQRILNVRTFSWMFKKSAGHPTNFSHIQEKCFGRQNIKPYFAPNELPIDLEWPWSMENLMHQKCFFCWREVMHCSTVMKELWQSLIMLLKCLPS